MTDPMRCWDCRYATPCGQCPMPFVLEAPPAPHPIVPNLSWWPEAAVESVEMPEVPWWTPDEDEDYWCD